MSFQITNKEKNYKNNQSFSEFKNCILELGFYEYSSYCEGDEIHTFFILRNTLYTIEVIQIDGLITSIIPF